MIPNTKKILVILGPTSSGKSDIAIKLAKKFNGEIISADSRQVFRGMDVGTGKIEGKFVGDSISNWRSNLHNIPHYMIDIVSPRTEYNVAKFKKQAGKVIEDILRRGKIPIICGGTGFWIQAIVDNMNFPEVKPDRELRKKLEKYPAEKLFAMLKKLDPDRAKTIDRNNKVRLIRAIEICKSIKKVPEIQNTRYKIQNTKYQFLQIGLKLSREKLYDNIENRVLARFDQGMIDEVADLHADGLSWKRIQSFGLAYFWIPEYLTGKITQNEMVEKVIQAERNYAKRQITWFKRDKRIQWMEDYRKIEKAVKEFLKKYGSRLALF
ncbi:MAG: tRNA (adenosine(37)-N6)-dimethylallyltransferase MiaA [Candidatus Moranbacteria bacterium]|nr:tRNA (adenosine(37)-N6)-dimethylallyltransferase MiaA [Candidatus Moranbacteria bacterium]